MKYAKGRIGRVFLLKFSDKDVLIPSLVRLAKKEGINCASLIFIGALREGNLVTGPKKPVIPPQPNQKIFKGGWEVMGLGTIFSNTKGSQVHIHASMGKKNSVLTGCIRGNSSVFLVVEAIILELDGIKAAKDIDPVTGLNLLTIF